MIANDIDIELQRLSRNPANCLISSAFKPKEQPTIL